MLQGFCHGRHPAFEVDGLNVDSTCIYFRQDNTKPVALPLFIRSEVGGPCAFAECVKGAYVRKAAGNSRSFDSSLLKMRRLRVSL